MVEALTLGYGGRPIQRDLNFTIYRGDIFAIMGGSGCGKSTLLRAMVGLVEPKGGRIVYHLEGEPIDFWRSDLEARQKVLRRSGVLFQSGALWSSMTLLQNVAFPLERYTTLDRQEREQIARLKLALVGLAGFEHLYPFEVSGGMRKRAALARASALDPEILFFDEPSAGLDPISAKKLDDLILELSRSLGATVVLVTHELPTILSIVTRGVFLDAETRTQLAVGEPKAWLKERVHPKVEAFLTRCGTYREEVA